MKHVIACAGTIALLSLAATVAGTAPSAAAGVRAPLSVADARLVEPVKSQPRRKAKTGDVLPVWPFNHAQRPRDLNWLLFGEPWGPDDDEARDEQIRAFFERSR